MRMVGGGGNQGSINFFELCLTFNFWLIGSKSQHGAMKLSTGWPLFIPIPHIKFSAYSKDMHIIPDLLWPKCL